MIGRCNALSIHHLSGDSVAYYQWSQDHFHQNLSFMRPLPRSSGHVSTSRCRCPAGSSVSAPMLLTTVAGNDKRAVGATPGDVPSRRCDVTVSLSASRQRSRKGERRKWGREVYCGSEQYMILMCVCVCARAPSPAHHYWQPWSSSPWNNKSSENFFYYTELVFDTKKQMRSCKDKWRGANNDKQE